MNHVQWEGYLRKDGRKGIRNYVLVVYLAESAHHAAREIADRFKDYPVKLMGFCESYSAAGSEQLVNAICTHPNVGAVLLVSKGGDCRKLEANVNQSGRPVNTIVLEASGDTLQAVEAGVDWVDWCLGIVDITLMVPMTIDELIVGTISDTMDTFSCFTTHTAVRRALNQLIANNGSVIFQVGAEMYGLEEMISNRAVNCKSGNSIISEIAAGEGPPNPGLPIMDVVGDQESLCGSANVSFSSEIVQMTASGCHLIIYATGPGSVAVSAVSPLIRIWSNSQTAMQTPENIDINAAEILQSGSSLEQAGDKIFFGILAVASGIPTCTEGQL